MSSLLAGKIAVVTGASSGIGRAVAVSFACEGASVVVADITEAPVEGGDPTIEIIARAGGAASFHKTNVARWEEVDSLIGSTIERHGRLDIMVNNAATYSSTPLLETEPAQWEEVLRVNLTGMFNGCKRAVQQMVTQEPRAEVRGRLINLGSQMGANKHNAAVVEALLRGGAKVNAKTYSGITALDLALPYSEVEHLLLSAGATPAPH